jgi:RNA polymerase sigma factor (sigma-70 family)
VLSDEELAKAAQGGDAVSLGILLERHRAPLQALALRILGHRPQQAQDVVQDVFLVALSTIERLREPKAVGGWLRGILHNVCLMQLREGRGEVPFDQLSGDDLWKGPSEPSAEEYIDHLALREWVWTALSELPEPLRVAVMLRYFGSYSSYKEISAILGVPIGTVSSRLSQVKVKLADALLKTARLEHDEARQLTESRARYFNAAWEEYSRGEGYELFVSAFSDDAVLAFPEGSVWHGRRPLAKDLEGDLEVGMTMHLTNFLANKDITVMEGALQNPPEDPFHCPPSISMVGFHRDGKQIQRMRIYFTSPTPRRLLDLEEEAPASKEEVNSVR